MQRKNRDCFPVRGAFGENHGSAYRSQPSKGLEGVLTLLSLSPSISPIELLPLILGSNSPACPLLSGSWEMFRHGALNPPAHTSSKQSAPGSLTFQPFLHVFYHRCNAATWSSSSDGLEECACHTHLDFTCKENGHLKKMAIFLELLFFHSQD